MPMRKTSPPRTVDARRRLQALRASMDTAESERLVVATLRIRVPNSIWLGTFSRSHPTVRIEVLNRGELEKGYSVSDYWISGGPPGRWSQEISTFKDVRKIDVIGEVGDGCLYRVTFANPPVVDLYRRLEMPIPFPLRIQSGVIIWEVVAREPEFRTIMEYARHTDPQLAVVSIRRQPLHRHLPILSDAQRDLLTQAMAAGYFAVPREITLTDLAKKLNRSKSGVSESLALIEQKLLESVMRAPVAIA
jgi:hypothetical protein